jgi:hypothetical protein
MVVMSLAGDLINIKFGNPTQQTEVEHVVGPDPELGIPEGEEERMYVKFSAEIPGVLVAEYRSGYLLNLSKILEPLRTG